MIDYKIENGIISHLITYPEDMAKVYNTIKPEMFQSLFCKKIYQELFSFFEKGKKFDEYILVNDLKAKEPEVEWENQLINIMSDVLNYIDLPSYAEILVKEYYSRQLIDFLAVQKINSSNVLETMANIQTFIETLKGDNKQNKIDMSDLMDYMTTCCFVDSETKALQTGLFYLDDCIKIEAGEITVLGARPSVGKSALALMIALNVARQGKKVAYFNLEMNKKHIGQRVIANASELDLARIVNAKAFLGDEQEQFNKAISDVRKLNFSVITGSLSDLDIVAECRFQEYDLVVIDYLQLIRCTKRVGNRREEVGAVSRKIKEMAMDLNIAVLLLSQLSRHLEYTQDKEPTMADLRETGDIEQDATNIILMWNLSDNEDYRAFKGLKVDKNRQGELMSECLDFDGKHMRFSECPKSLAEIKSLIETDSDIDINEDIPFN